MPELLGAHKLRTEFVAPQIPKEQIGIDRRLSFLEHVGTSFEESILFYSPTVALLSDRHNLRAQQEKFLKEQEAMTDVVSPSTFSQHLTASLGSFVGQIPVLSIDPVWSLSLTASTYALGSAFAALPIGMGLAGRVLTGAITSGTSYTFSSGVQQAAQKKISEKRDLIFKEGPTTKEAFELGFAMGGLGVLLGGIGKVATRGLRGVKGVPGERYSETIRRTKNKDPYHMSRDIDPEAYNGNNMRESAQSNAVTNYSDNMWRDSAGNIYDGGALVVKHDEAIGDAARPHLPVNDDLWEMPNFNYTDFLRENFDSVFLEEQAAHLGSKSGIEARIADLEALESPTEEQLTELAEARERLSGMPERLDITDITAEMHRKGTEKYVESILDFAKSAPDKLTAYKRIVDSLVQFSPQLKARVGRATLPIQEAYRAVGQRNLEETVLASDESQARVLHKFKDPSQLLTPEENAVYEAIRDALNVLVQEARASGINYGFNVEDYTPVQFKSSAEMRKNGITRELFWEIHKDALDWERMVLNGQVVAEGTEFRVLGGREAEALRKKYIESVYDEIMADEFVRPFHQSLSYGTAYERRDKSRVFHFKSGSDQMKLMRLMGYSDNILDATFRHIASFAREITKHRIMGADPLYFERELKRAVPQSVITKPDMTKPKQNFYRKTFYREAGMRNVLDKINQKHGWVDVGGFWRALDDIGNVITASRLGGLWRYAIGEDVVRSYTASKEFGIAMENVMEAVFPGGKLDMDVARRLGLVVDTMRHLVPIETTLFEMSPQARSFIEGMHKYSGSTFLTNRQKAMNAMWFQRSIAEEMGKVGGDFAKLKEENPALYSFLRRNGVTAKDWKNWSKFKIEINDVELIAPHEIWKIKDTEVRNSAIKFLETMHDFIGEGVLESNELATAAMLGVPGTGVLGFLNRSFQTFIGAPVALSYNLLRSRNPMQRIKFEFAWIVLSGVLMGLLADIAQGKRPAYEDFTVADWALYFMKAYKEGGGFGILSDWGLVAPIATLSTLAEGRRGGSRQDMRRELANQLIGARANLLLDLGLDTYDMLERGFRLQNPEIVNHVERHVPNLPGLQVLNQRWIMKAAKEWLHEDIHAAETRRQQSLRRQRKKELFQ